MSQRDEIAQVIAKVCDERFGTGCCFTDDTAKAVFPEIAESVRAEDVAALADALIRAGYVTPTLEELDGIRERAFERGRECERSVTPTPPGLTAEKLREIADWVGRAELPCVADILGMRRELLTAADFLDTQETPQ